MTFLQPWVLAALPLVALPLVIHLINQRRFQTMPWAAMMFLASARALSRGYSRLRHWLIMMLRMAAVAAVILAVGRPLSRGWLALAGGGRPDTAVVILDRSPSMQQRGAGDEGKLEAGRRRLAATLATLAPNRCVLVADAERPPQELTRPADLADSAGSASSAAPADMLRMLQLAYDHVRENAAGSTEVWICSDQRSNDWALDAGGWGSLRDAFAKLPQQVRFQLLSDPRPAAGNVAVRVTAARLETRGAGRELLVTVVASRQEEAERLTLPLKFEIGGATTVVSLELAGREAVLKNHAIPLERSAATPGWGRVSLPADENPADNEFYFAFDEPAARRVLVVAEDPAARRVLELVAGIPPGKDDRALADVVDPASLVGAAWDEAAVLLWQADLPTGRDAELVAAFVARGGQVIFFPPEVPTPGRSFAGMEWGSWTGHAPAARPQSWRNDQGPLANTLSGGALPLGDLEIRRSCGLSGDGVPLATLAEGVPLVVRVAGQDNACFCATTPAPRDSSLAAEGVVLYALVQRAVDRGIEPLGRARQIDAGSAAVALAAAGPWSRLAGPADSPAGGFGLHAGVFSAGGKLVAVNRPAAEDAGRIVADDRIDAAFNGLSLTRIAPGGAGAADSLVQEIWRAFLIAMLVALVGEGLLSLPRRAREERASGFPAVEAAA
jgi:hypothetical protein